MPEDSDPSRLFGDESALPESRLKQDPRVVISPLSREDDRQAQSAMRALMGGLALAVVAIVALVWLLIASVLAG